MDLRVLSSAAGFTPPHCFELCGRHFDISLTGDNEQHDDVALEFMSFPSREVTVTGKGTASGTFAYDCSKVMDGLYQVAYRCGGNTCDVLTIDVNEGNACLMIVTAVGNLECRLFTGKIGGESTSFQRRSSDELAGNTVDWTFGVEESSAVRIRYGNRRKNATRDEYVATVECGSQQIRDAVYGTYRLRDDAFYQYMFMETDSRKRLTVGIADFTNMLGVGVVLEMEGGEMRYQKTGCYARIISYEA
ncbi:MAG: hypothetical protein IKH56_00465 [Oscillospiraceae bacterium]|nr:hypothetical protein [Oscillospiraceae bacterium]